VSHHRRSAFALLFLAACPLSAAYGQSTKAELFGTVRDPGGLPVSGAAVDLVNAGTEAKFSVVSGATGSYHFLALAAGTYSLMLAK